MIDNLVLTTKKNTNRSDCDVQFPATNIQLLLVLYIIISNIFGPVLAGKTGHGYLVRSAIIRNMTRSFLIPESHAS